MLTLDSNNLGDKDISAIWTCFTKCKDNLNDGARLENMSWRLWYRNKRITTTQIDALQKTKIEFPPSKPTFYLSEESSSEEEDEEDDYCPQLFYKISPYLSLRSSLLSMGLQHKIPDNPPTEAVMATSLGVAGVW
jgi:hypothetical protein